MKKITLYNNKHETETTITIRGNIIQPGVMKDIKKKLCTCDKCGPLGACGCKEGDICCCKEDRQGGEEYAVVTRYKDE